MEIKGPPGGAVTSQQLADAASLKEGERRLTVERSEVQRRVSELSRRSILQLTDVK
ncbi:hypothetical protein HDG38_004442 [Paraburkholderia sp. WSM4177]|nr:hypothetical protein [Paraburkholderia sp. WSM4177]MBB5486467.1 hypothetical protein [Paraburkholderia sp. WSM4180]